MRDPRPARDPRSTKPKALDRLLLISERDVRVSNSKREAYVMSQAQPTLEIRVSTPREVRVSTKQRETCVQNGMSSRYKKPKSPHL